MTGSNFGCFGLWRIRCKKVFFKAVKEGDVCQVKVCLSQAPRLVFENQFFNDWTAWHYAAARGYIEVLLELWTCTLQLGSKCLKDAVNSTDQKLQTPLMCACLHGQEHSVRLLLAMGADPWLRDRCGEQVALHLAAKSGHVGCIQALLEHISYDKGNLVDDRTIVGHTPLHYAVCYGHINAMILLLEFGADLNAQAREFSYAHNIAAGCSPLHIAAKNVDLGAAVALLKFYVHQKQEAINNIVLRDVGSIYRQDFGHTYRCPDDNPYQLDSEHSREKYDNPPSDLSRHLTHREAGASGTVINSSSKPKTTKVQEVVRSEDIPSFRNFSHSAPAIKNVNSCNMMEDYSVHSSMLLQDPRLVKNADGQLPCQVTSTHIQNNVLQQAMRAILNPKFPIEVLNCEEETAAVLGDGFLPLIFAQKEHQLLAQIEQAEQQLSLKHLLLSLGAGLSSRPGADTTYGKQIQQLLFSQFQPQGELTRALASKDLTPPCSSKVAMASTLTTIKAQKSMEERDMDNMSPKSPERVCGVCMDARATMTISQCNHNLCCHCAKSIVELRHFSNEVLCPFCRQPIDELALAC